MKQLLLLLFTLTICFSIKAQQYFTFGQMSPTNSDGNRTPVGWIKGATYAPSTYLWSIMTDILEIWGNSGASVSVGSIQVGEASLVAIRIY